MDVGKASKDTEKNVRRKSLRCGNKATKRIRIIERKSVMRNFFCGKAEFICICQKKAVSLHPKKEKLFSTRGGLYRQVHLHFANIGVDGLLRNMKMDASVLHQMKMRLFGELCLQSQQKIIAFETDP